MAIEVELPDGSVVEFPDGTDNATMERALAQHSSPDFSNVQGGASGGDAVSVGGQDAATMPAWKNAAYGLVSPVADSIVGVGQMTGLMDDKTAQESLARIDAVRSRTPGKVAGFVGDVGMMALPASKIAKLPKAMQYAGNALLGAGFGGTRGTREGESRLLNTAIGGGLGVAGQGANDLMVAGGKRAAAAITPEIRALMQKAQDAGIRVTPAQLSESPSLKGLRSVAGRLPFSGATKVAKQQQAQFNRAVSKTFGEDAPAITPEVYAAAKKRIGQQFNDLSERNALPVGDDLLNKLVGVHQEAMQTGEESIAKAVGHQIGRIVDQTKDGVLPGRAYQSLDSNIGSNMKFGGEKAHYLGRVRDVLREAMDSAISPADQAAWQTARSQYKNLKTIRDLVAKENGNGISPAQLAGRVNATGSGKEAMASNRGGDLGDLAKIGQRFIKDPIPNSGTAERLGWMGLLGGGSAALGAKTMGLSVAGGAAARGLLDSPMLTSLMLREGRGQGQQALAPYLRAGLLGSAPEASSQAQKRKRKKRP